MENDIITAYVSLGSNLGDRAGNLLMAVRGLFEASLPVFRLSAIYETEPVGMENADNFLNMAAEIHLTNITPSQMMSRMLRIEYLLGRRNKYRHLPRSVDLDLLFYGDLQYETDFLTLPHPKLHQRGFVLAPMAEIAPHFVHPILQKTVQELLEETGEESKARRWNSSRIKDEG